MNCPNDNTPLAMTERQGIEIDYCPTCRGVWLDRGELDKLIAGAGREQMPMSDRDQDRSHSHGYKKHKRESFLGDLFDF